MVGNTNNKYMNMTQAERLDNRTKNCGSFELALIRAWFKADSINKKILEEAFKDTMFNLK